MSFDNCDLLTELLTNTPDYCKMVFGVKTVSSFNITSLSFQLVASKIPIFQKEKDNTMECVLAKHGTGQHNYKDIKCCATVSNCYLGITFPAAVDMHVGRVLDIRFLSQLRP